MRIRPAAMFAVGLLLVAGCSTGRQAEPARPEAPPPTRALVTWSETVCSNLSTVDSLREKHASTYYAMQVASDVDTVLASLRDLEPSRVKPADDYVTTLTRRLERLREQLPQDGTAPPPDPRRVTELIEGLGKQQPELARLAARTRSLAPSYHLAPSCNPLKPRPELSTAATRPLVRWADTMCEVLTSVRTVPEPGDELLKHPSFARFESMELSSYLTSVPSQVRSLGQPLTELPRTGIAEADAYRSALRTAIDAAAARLPEDSATMAFDLYDLPIEQLRARAREMAGVVTAIRPPGPDLSALARKHPALAASYDLAPTCEPADVTPSRAENLPQARNGTDVAACRGGTCQIEVSAPVDVTVRGTVFTIAVSDGTVWIAGGSGLIRLSGAGTAQFGTGGVRVTFSVAEMTDTAAVLDVSAK